MAGVGADHRHVRDEERTDMIAAAEAVKAGARTAVRKAHADAVAAAGAAGANGGGDGGSGGGLPGEGAPADPMVDAVLRLSVAAEAAGKGAYTAFLAFAEETERRHPGRPFAAGKNINQIAAAASAGGAAGVMGVAYMAALNAANNAAGQDIVMPAAIELEVAVAGAGTGAWHACFNAVQGLPPSDITNRWAPLLAPLLAGCLVTAANEFAKLFYASHWSSLAVLGGMGVVILALMVGIIAAIPFRSVSGATVSRHMTFLTFCVISVFYTSGMCYMTWDMHYPAPAVVVGVIGVVGLAILIVLWFQSGRVRQ